MLVHDPLDGHDKSIVEQQIMIFYENNNDNNNNEKTIMARKERNDSNNISPIMVGIQHINIRWAYSQLGFRRMLGVWWEKTAARSFSVVWYSFFIIGFHQYRVRYLVHRT